MKISMTLTGRILAVVALLVAASVLVPRTFASPPARESEAVKPWVFFDLGENSLVATPKDPNTGDIVKLSWMRYVGEDGKEADARTYLEGLRVHGYSVGLIVNIPQDWGDPLAARHGARAVYQATGAADVAGALRAGLRAYRLPYSAGLTIQRKGYYLGEAELDDLARD